MTREEAIRILILCDKKPNCKYTEGMIKRAQEVSSAIVIGQKPLVKLDRRQWAGCETCKNLICATCKFAAFEYDDHPCDLCKCGSLYEKVSYCPDCGRPLTEEAWAELERRIGGNDGN